jgi:hypothetical protein
MHLLIQLLLCASILVDAFFQQHRLDCSISKDDASSKKAVNYSEEDLYCAALARVAHGDTAFPTPSLPLGHLECAHGVQLACRLGPRPDWIERHLEMS